MQRTVVYHLLESVSLSVRPRRRLTVLRPYYIAECGSLKAPLPLVRNVTAVHENTDRQTSLLHESTLLTDAFTEQHRYSSVRPLALLHQHTVLNTDRFALDNVASAGTSLSMVLTYQAFKT